MGLSPDDLPWDFRVGVARRVYDEGDIRIHATTGESDISGLACRIGHGTLVARRTAGRGEDDASLLSLQDRARQAGQFARKRSSE